MKRSVLRIGCAVLSLSAAAGLLASCSLLPPASPLPDSKPAQAEEAPGPAAAPLDDGKLRILYSNGSNGGNTVLCGNTVLYQAASSETVYLVPDTLTGTVRYYLRQWSAPGTPTGRATALCDRSGKEILTFDRAYDAVLTGSLKPGHPVLHGGEDHLRPAVQLRLPKVFLNFYMQLDIQSLQFLDYLK